jgi:hypothetical protein
MTAFHKAEALAGQRYDRDKLLAMVDEVTTHYFTDIQSVVKILSELLVANRLRQVRIPAM